ncbi:MAG: hypothetical protein LBF63_07265, partial [Treponema sp.]|nr:hypothetical protein [Treponema sp.]
MELRDQPLGREELKKVIEGKGAARRIPLAVHTWMYRTTIFGSREPEYKALLERYPSDIQVGKMRMPGIFDAPPDDPSYRWLNYDKPAAAEAALDSACAIDSWDRLDGILADFPDPGYPGLTGQKAPDDSVYRIGHWPYWLFERLW